MPPLKCICCAKKNLKFKLLSGHLCITWPINKLFLYLLTGINVKKHKFHNITLGIKIRISQKLKYN